jgi:CubicO group peptidase (beta-lactamase class C family)
MPSSTRARVSAAVAAAAVLAAGFALRPQPPALSPDTTGDTALAERARPLLEEGPRATAAVVEVDDGRIRGAYFGSDESTRYEIGSVSKSLTGMLLADAVERGEVTEDTELGSLLDLGEAPAASVTLAELSGHQSGLPGNPPKALDRLGLAVNSMRNQQPYTAEDVDALVTMFADAELSDRGEHSYSNLGAAALGQALAAAAGTDYPTLVRERILDPLEMDDSLVPADPEEVPAAAATGYANNGRPFAPMANAVWAPSGGAYSTGADMGLLALALLTGEAPGTEAMEPRWEDGSGDGVGLGWYVTDHDGTEVTWHNGITGGFHAILALDREGERAVVILSDTPAGTHPAAIDLLLEET